MSRALGQTRRLMKGAVLAGSLAVAGFCMPTVAAADEASPTLKEGLFGSVERWVGNARSELPKERFVRLSKTPEVMDATSARKWDIVVTLLKSQNAMNQLKLVQQFVNSQKYASDDTLWGSADYWSSAAEFLQRGGDCEDFALTKYRALIDAGFPAENLRLVLVEENFTGEQHAVLAVNHNGRRLILDNRRDEIEDHELVSNYRPLYSMNAEGLWQHHDTAQPIPQIAVATKGQ